MPRAESEKPLRIAVIQSPVISTPVNRDRVPPGWSGAPEQITFELANELGRRGHEVILFATGETQPGYNVEVGYVRQKSSFEDPEIGLGGNKQHEQLLISKAYTYADEFDIFQSSLPKETAGVASLVLPPTVATIHAPITDFNRVLFPLLARTQRLVSISYGQRQDYPQEMFAENIYHGVDPDLFQFDPAGGDGLVMVSRMERSKGPDIAVKAAQRLGMRLQLVGSNWGDRTKGERRDPYWERVMKRVENDPDPIELVGHVDRDETVRYHQKAKVALHPVQMVESFGLSIAESMACGTPVIAFANGSTPELIKDGETGFLVNSHNRRTGDWEVKKTGAAGFVEAISRINSMSEADYLDMRKRSREHVIANFTLGKMAENYEGLYRRVLRTH